MEEQAAKDRFRARADSLLPAYGRHPLRFDLDGPADVSVLMVVHDNFALTLQALASLRQGTAGGIELVLVDSGSSDETRHIGRYVTGARLLRFLRQTKQGAGKPARQVLQNDLLDLFAGPAHPGT